MSNEALEKVIAELQAQVAALTSKLAHIEPHEEQPPVPEAEAPEPEPEPVEPAIPEEIVLAISAAVAAYLGERAHVRAIRLISTTRWSQEGRVSIQASHRLERG